MGRWGGGARGRTRTCAGRRKALAAAARRGGAAPGSSGGWPNARSGSPRAGTRRGARRRAPYGPASEEAPAGAPPAGSRVEAPVRAAREGVREEGGRGRVHNIDLRVQARGKALGHQECGAGSGAGFGAGDKRKRPQLWRGRRGRLQSPSTPQTSHPFPIAAPLPPRRSPPPPSRPAPFPAPPPGRAAPPFPPCPVSNSRQQEETLTDITATDMTNPA